MWATDGPVTTDERVDYDHCWQDCLSKARTLPMLGTLLRVLSMGERRISPKQAFRLAVYGGAIGGFLAMGFYRVFLPLTLGKRGVSCVLPSVSAGADTVVSAFVAGALGGALLCKTSLVYRRPTARGRRGLTMIVTGVVGGLVLACAQAVMDKAHLSLSTKYWPEFLVFGGLASVWVVRLVQFTHFRSLGWTWMLCMISSIPGTCGYVIVASLRRKDWWPAVSWLGPHGKAADADLWCWLGFVVVACWIYLWSIVAVVYFGGVPVRPQTAGLAPPS
jgi:hypothetical protein